MKTADILRKLTDKYHEDVDMRFDDLMGQCEDFAKVGIYDKVINADSDLIERLKKEGFKVKELDTGFQTTQYFISWRYKNTL